MITVYTPQDKLFNYTEVEEMFNTYKKQLQDDNFDDILKTTDFFAFYISETRELIGCIYYFKKAGKRYVNAFAGRKHHLINLECLKESLKWFKSDIYAKALHKASRLCVLRCGFKKVKDNLYVYRRK